jgi:3-oxoadipate enol-lactonase
MSRTTESSFTTSDGCEIAYTLHAHPDTNAPRAALIHSLALDRSVWDGVVAELAPHASILTYDCRGHGRSSPVDMPYTAAQFADDLAQLMDHVGWRAATVAGCSMGGCVAQAFAANYPDRTQGACLIDTTAWYGAEAPKQWRERAATAEAKGMGALIDFQVTRWFTDGFRATHAEAVNALIKVFLANDVRCYLRTCEMLGNEDLRPLLAAIKAPTAVVVGAEDYATPVSMAEVLHQAIPQSTLTIIAKGRHITPAECPQDIARELKRLLKI